MNDQEILDGNKLIAEFLGFKFKNGIAQNEVFYTLEKEHPIYLQGYSYRCTKFHSSWDWLMPVVEKIGVLKYSYQLNSLDNKMYYFWIHKYDEEGNDEISPIGYNGKWEESCIQVIFKAIIEFIKWYNKNKKL